jgi:sec-independent protein translocase protein TatC
MFKQNSNFSLVDNLLEIRSRLLKSLLVTFIAFCGLVMFANEIYQLFALPLYSQLPAGSAMIATSVASPFLAPFKLTLIVAFFITIPYWLHQLWKFIAPGLYKHEKRIALTLIITSSLLFYCGIMFAYFVVFPILFLFFTTVGPSTVQIMTDINSYLDFSLKLFFAFGISFEIPILIIVLIITDIVSIAKFKAIRSYVVILCFVLGMLLTPPDVISQTLLAVPMWLLFELGLVIGAIFKNNNQSIVENSE